MSNYTFIKLEKNFIVVLIFRIQSVEFWSGCLTIVRCPVSPIICEAYFDIWGETILIPKTWRNFMWSTNGDTFDFQISFSPWNEWSGDNVSAWRELRKNQLRTVHAGLGFDSELLPRFPRQRYCWDSDDLLHNMCDCPCPRSQWRDDSRHVSLMKRCISYTDNIHNPLVTMYSSVLNRFDWGSMR